VRRIVSLSAGIPAGTASWGNAEEMLATLAELMDHNNRLYMAAHGLDLPEPITVPRPHERVEPEKPQRPPTGSSLSQVFAQNRDKFRYDPGG
jgi:hypothetical protein